MEQFAIYLWSIVENIQGLLTVLGILLLIAMPIFLIAIAETCDEDFPKQKIIRSITASCIVFFLATLIPSKQDLALIFAYPYLKAGVQNVAQSETVSKLRTVASKYLDKIIADLDKAGATK